ncbi:MAG: hypothetical protein ABIZ34_04055 [Candidatus Limnocylindrales bacterium]
MPQQDLQRHTGVVAGRSAPRRPPTARRRPAPPSDQRGGWILLVAAVVVALIGIVWFMDAGRGPSAVTAVAAPTFTATTGGRTPTLTAAPSSAATILATASPTLAATPPSTLPPTQAPSPTPSLTLPSPIVAPTPSPTIQPSPTPKSELGFAIDFPADGERLDTRQINIIGTGPRDATITHDVPLWFDEHTVVRGDGIWMMPISLSDGENRLTFRIGDDRSTEVVVTVVYSAPP